MPVWRGAVALVGPLYFSLRWEVLAGIIRFHLLRKWLGSRASGAAVSEVTDRNYWETVILGVVLVPFRLFRNGDLGYNHQTRNFS